MTEAVAHIDIPKRALFKAAEVCDLVSVQPYVLRSWEAEFPALGITKAGGSQRVYRRSDVEQVVRIKNLLLVEGLTLAGARRRLEEESAPVGADAAAIDELIGQNARRCSDPSYVCFEPRGVVGCVHRARRRSERAQSGVGLRRPKMAAVQFEKGDGRCKPEPLVAGCEGTLLHETEPISRRETKHRRLTGRVAFLGPRQRRLQRRFVTHARRAAESRQQLLLKGEDRRARDPDGFAHFASSRSAFR